MQRAKEPSRHPREVCFCGKGLAHPHKVLASCPLDAPVPHVPRTFHIRVTAGNLADGLMCGIEPGTSVYDQTLKFFQARAWDPSKTWRPCPECCEAASITTTGEDIEP